MAVREEPRIHDADLDPAVSSACLFAVARNARVGLAKALGSHDRRGDSSLHQEVADGFGAALGQLQIVRLRADIVRVSVDSKRSGSLSGIPTPPSSCFAPAADDLAL